MVKPTLYYGTGRGVSKVISTFALPASSSRSFQVYYFKQICWLWKVPPKSHLLQQCVLLNILQVTLITVIYVSFLNPAQHLIQTGTKKMDKIKCTVFKKWCKYGCPISKL